MNNDELDNQLRNYFSDTKLNSAKLDDIIAESARLTGSDQSLVSEAIDDAGWWASVKQNRMVRSLIPFGVIAAPVMISAYFVVTVLVGSENHNRDDTADLNAMPLAGGSVELASLVLQEAAMNHQSKLQLDIDARDMDTLQSGMQRLDFDLSIPDALAAGYELLGGRYCTIGGQLAAHLRLENRHSEVSPGAAPGTSDSSDAQSFRARSVFVTRSRQ